MIAPFTNAFEFGVWAAKWLKKPYSKAINIFPEFDDKIKNQNHIEFKKGYNSKLITLNKQSHAK